MLNSKRQWLTIALVAAASSCGSSPQRYLDKANGLFSAGRYAEADINYQKAIQIAPEFGEAYYRFGLSKFREGRLTESYQALSKASGLLPKREDVSVALADTSFALYLGNRGDANLYSQIASISAQLLQTNPNSYDGLRLKGYLSMLDRHPGDAIDLLKRAIAIKPGESDVIDVLVQCLIANGQAPEGEKLALDSIQRLPTQPVLYDTLYNFYIENKRFADGEAILRKKVDNNPAVLAYRIQLARHYAAANNEAALQSTVQKVMDDPARFPGSFMEVGNFYFSLSRYDDALRAFQAGAKQDHERKSEYDKRGVEVLIAEKKWDTAMAAAQEMLKADSHSVEGRSLKAEIELDAGDAGKAQSALQDLRDLVKQDPKNAVLHFNLGRAYLATNDSESALSEFNLATNLDPRFLQPRVFAANVSLQRQDYQQANRYADEIVRLSGGDASARLLQAASLRGIGNFTEAAKELSQLSRQYPNSPAIELQVGELKRAQKDYAGAEAIFRRVFESDRTNLVALRKLLDTYYEQGKYDIAIQYITQESRRSNSLEIRNLLADAALRGNKLDLAVQEYSRISAAQPQSPTGHLKLGDAYLQQGQVSQAVAEFETARKLAPKDALVNAMLALAFHNSGKPEEALKAYRDTLALQSNNPQVKNNLAYLMAETGGNLDEALRLAQEASKAMPGDVALSDTVGWIYFKKKNTDSAIQVLSNVVRKDGRNPVYLYHLGAALFEKGDRAGAKKELETAMNNRPSKAYEDRIRDLLTRIQ